MLPAQPPYSRRRSGTRNGHAENVDLLGQDVLLELVVKHHDGVEGERAADQGVHRVLSKMSEWGIIRVVRLVTALDVTRYRVEVNGQACCELRIFAAYKRFGSREE